MNVVVIEVSENVIQQPRPWTDPKTNVVKIMDGKQAAYIHQGDVYPLVTEIPFSQEAGPYRPGRYLLAGRCFQLTSVAGANGKSYVRLGLNDRELSLVPAEAAAEFLLHGVVATTSQGETSTGRPPKLAAAN